MWLIYLYVSHPVHQLPNHAVPDLRLWISGSVFPVRNDGDLVPDADVPGDLGRQIHAVSFKLVISFIHLPVLLQHHVRSFLNTHTHTHTHTERERQRWAGMVKLTSKLNCIINYTFQNKSSLEDWLLFKNHFWLYSFFGELKKVLQISILVSRFLKAPV